MTPTMTGPVRPQGPTGPTPTGPTPTHPPRSYRTQPTNDPDPVTNPQNPRPKWAVACLIAAAVLAFGALLLWDIVLVPMAVVGGR